jgi:hypothetical protein
MKRRAAKGEHKSASNKPDADSEDQEAGEKKRKQVEQIKCHECKKAMTMGSRKIREQDWCRLDGFTFCKYECRGVYADRCPECQQPATSHCKCLRGGRSCNNGHEWYICRVHDRRRPGTGHGVSDCGCVTELKLQPTTAEMLEYVKEHHTLPIQDELEMFLAKHKLTKEQVTQAMHQPAPVEASDTDKDEDD